MSEFKIRQLLAAAGTVTRRTPLGRVRVLRRLLGREVQRRRPYPTLSAALYYLNLGTVPRSLWEE